MGGTLKELKKKKNGLRLKPRMWKGWGKKEAREVEPGFYIKDRGNHLEV